VQANWPARAVALAVLISVALATALAIAAPPRAGGRGSLREASVRLTAAQRHVAMMGQAAAERRTEEAQTPLFPVAGRADLSERDGRFGVSRPGHVHQGQDVFAKPGTPLLAVSDAVVVDEGNGGGRGNFVELFDRARRLTYVYFHMLRAPRVRKGEHVHPGERVGAVGCTGSCWGPHLHFEIHVGRGARGRAIDPLPMLRRWRRERV
jgi:murein DD-endopeptidase MepM/ murein hydrolase activator NlpD